MSVALVWLALVAVIVLEIRWLARLQREWLVIKRMQRQGEKGARYRKELGVVVEGARDGSWIMRGRRAGKDFVVRQAASIAPPWGGEPDAVASIVVAAGASPL